MPDEESTITFEIRQGKELLNIKESVEFASAGDFVNAMYLSSKKEYLPIGLIGEKQKVGLVDGVANVVGGVANAATKMISSIGNVLTLSDTPEETTMDFKNVRFFNSHLSKKEKIVIKPDTTIIVIHNK